MSASKPSTLLPSAPFPTPGWAILSEPQSTTCGHSCGLTHPKIPWSGLPCQGFTSQGGRGDESRHCPPKEALLEEVFKSQWGTWLCFSLKLHPAGPTALPQVCQYLVGYLGPTNIQMGFCGVIAHGMGLHKTNPCDGHAHVSQNDRTNSQSVCVFFGSLLSYDTKGKLP